MHKTARDLTFQADNPAADDLPSARLEPNSNVFFDPWEKSARSPKSTAPESVSGRGRSKVYADPNSTAELIVAAAIAILVLLLAKWMGAS